MKHSNIFIPLIVLLAIMISSGASCQRKPKPIEVIEVRPAGPDFNADSAYAYCYAQCEFGPRTMNSDAHERCGQWIAGKFQEFGCQVELLSRDMTAPCSKPPTSSHGCILRNNSTS